MFFCFCFLKTKWKHGHIHRLIVSERMRDKGNSANSDIKKDYIVRLPCWSEDTVSILTYLWKKKTFCNPLDSLFCCKTLGQVTHSFKQQANHCREIGWLFITCEIYIKISWDSTKGMFTNFCSQRWRWLLWSSFPGCDCRDCKNLGEHWGCCAYGYWPQIKTFCDFLVHRVTSDFPVETKWRIFFFYAVFLTIYWLDFVFDIHVNMFTLQIHYVF